MNNFLLFLASLLILVLAALFFGPAYINWDNHRDELELQMTRILGVDAQLGGELKVKLLPRPFLEVGDVTFLNKHNPEQYLKAKKLTVRLSVPPLLKGQVEADYLSLNKPELNLQMGEKGAISWAFKNAFNNDEKSKIKGFSLGPEFISLKHVEVENGLIKINDKNGQPIDEWRKITGRLSAETLSGPFKFNGQTTRDDHPFKIDLVSGKTNKQGAVPLHLHIRDLGRALDFHTKGKIVHFTSTPKLTGTVTLTRMKSNKTSPKSASKGEALPNIEEQYLSAKITADHRKMIFTDMKANFNDRPIPHPVKGRLTYDWEKGALSGDLQFGWLNFDQLFKNALLNQEIKQAGLSQTQIHFKQHPAPFKAFAGLLNQLPNLLPKTQILNVGLKIDQLTYHDQMVENLTAKLKRDSNKQKDIYIDQINADLPGRHHLGGQATISPYTKTAKEKAPQLTAQFWLDGDNLPKLASWGLNRQLTALPFITSEDDINDGGTLPFSLGFNLIGFDQKGQTHIQLTNLNGAIGQVKIYDGLWKPGQQANQQNELFLSISKLSLDSDEDGDGDDKEKAHHINQTSALATQDLNKQVQKKLANWQEFLGAGPFSFRLKAKQGLIGKMNLNNLALDFEGRKQQLFTKAASVNFGQSRLQLQFEGARDNHKNKNTPSPKQAMTLIADIKTRLDLKNLQQIFPQFKAVFHEQRADQLLPIFIHAKGQNLAQDSSAAPFIAAAKLADSHFELKGTTARNKKGQMLIDVTGSGVNENGRQLTAQLMPMITGMMTPLSSDNQPKSQSDQPHAPQQNRPGQKGRADFHFKGALNGPLSGTLNLTTAGLNTRFSGPFPTHSQSRSAANKDQTTKGTLVITANNQAQFLSLFGIKTAKQDAADQNPEGNKPPLDEMTRLIKQELGEDDHKGHQDKKVHFKTNITKDGEHYELTNLTLRLPSQTITGHGTIPLPQAGKTNPFHLSLNVGRSSFAGLTSILLSAQNKIALPQGRITLNAHRFDVMNNLSLKEVTTTAEFNLDQVKIISLKGVSTGGALIGAGTIKKTLQRGWIIDGELTLQNGDLALLGREDNLIGNGPFQAALKFSGAGKTEDELLNNLAGIGRLTLSKGQLYMHNTDQMRKIISETLQQREGQANLRQELRLLADRKPTSVSSLDIPLQLLGGQLKLSPIEIPSILGKAGGAFHYDLKSQNWQANWRYHFEPDQLAGRIPSFNLRYKGKGNDWANKQVEFDLDQLETFLQLRRKELLLRKLSRPDGSGGEQKQAPVQ